MKIFLNILFLIIGFASLIIGANYFVNGASAVAKKLKVPSIIIGLTIVAIGTSLPELAVSVTSAISGSADLSVGNVVGSNLSNMLLILGVVAIMSNIPIQKGTKKFDLPFMIGVTALLLFFGADSVLGFNSVNVIKWWEALILFLLFIAYMVIQIMFAKKQQNFAEQTVVETEKEEKPEKQLKVWQIVLFLIGGLAAVVFGGECVSRTSKFLAMAAGMSEALVGVTIVALGTSLPELVTSVVAARKGETDLAVGNVVGSNIMNIVLILGTSGLITSINISMTMLVDTLILFVASVIFMLVCLSGNKINRLEGIMLVVMYFAYMTMAIVRNYAV